jgi:hypothetical protein
MDKLVLLSVLLSMIALPIIASQQKNPRKALKRALTLVLAFNAFYVIALRFIYPRFL